MKARADFVLGLVFWMGLATWGHLDGIPHVRAQEAEVAGIPTVLGAEDLAERGEIARNRYRRITPGDSPLVQDAGTWPVAWAMFGTNWLRAPAFREAAAWVVPVALVQDGPATVVCGADGTELWRGETDFARPESSDVVLTGGLVAEEDWETYEAVREELAVRSAALAMPEAARRDGARSGGRSAPPTNGLRFVSVAVETNGAVRLGLAWEEDGEVDLFACAVAHTSSWVVATWTNDENAVVTSTNLVWTPVGDGYSGMNGHWKWVGTAAVSNGVAEFTDSGFPEGEGRMRFYAAAKAADADNDALTDGWEAFVTHTDPFEADSDNDLFLDGEEVLAGLDPNNPDMDGDGLLDGWEVHNGLDPLDPDGDNGPDGDPDGDGFPNALEAALGGLAQGAAWSSGQLAYRLLHLQNGDGEPGLRVDIEDAWNCEGGTCHVRQNVTATLAVPDLMDWGVFLDITVQGKVEDQNRGYDIVTIEALTNTFFFEGNENHNGCTMAAKTATCRVLVLPNSTVKLRYDTNGSMYHKGAYAAITGASFAGAIKSETVSAYPANDRRTELGVGEEIVLTAPLFLGGAVWYRDGETTPIGTGPMVDFTAPDVGGTVQLSATFDGHVVSRGFQILEPAGIASAKISTPEFFFTGCPGAGMRLYPIVVGPTNVSFYNVSIKEVGRAASNCTGWWANHSAPPHDFDAGADRWILLDHENTWRDHAAWGLPDLWQTLGMGAGHFEWEIPALWRVGNNGQEHSMTGWSQETDLDVNGTVTIRKFGKWITRTINGTINHN